MESDVREALRHLTTAFELHLDAVVARRSPEDAAVDDAYEALALAFERYEDALDIEYAEGLPVVLAGEDDEDDDLDEADEDDEIDDDEDDDLDTDMDAPDVESVDEIDDDLDEFNLHD
jgi:hypothetical protein